MCARTAFPRASSSLRGIRSLGHEGVSFVAGAARGHMAPLGGRSRPQKCVSGSDFTHFGVQYGVLVATRKLYCFRILDVFWCHQGGFWGLWLKRLQTSERSREAPLGSLRGSRRPPEGGPEGAPTGPRAAPQRSRGGFGGQNPRDFDPAAPQKSHFFCFHKNFSFFRKNFLLP